MSEPMTEDGPSVDEPVADPAPVEPEIQQQEPEAVWAPPREEWDYVRSTLEQLAQAQQQSPQQFYQEPQAPDYSAYFPVDPMTGEANVTLDGIDRLVADRAAQMVEQRLSQYEPVMNQTIAERGETLIQQKFDALSKPVSEGGIGGQFNTKYARTLAEGYAASGMDPNHAIQQAAREAYEFAQAERKAGAEEYKNTLGNIGKAPREPGAESAGVYDESQPPEGVDKYKWLANRWVDRQRLPG